ncbi:AsmA protein [Halospina denitrificans]|uniref:AsmA protein n=1 Tax=Halospina denitrificans TaxID=332522 RepID=A0A4R7K1W5_9GAMM|nr:AsmA family protein [Halospina denitrificans]TDT43499.1 AsmA protein [Halospina denitrificans]
MRLLRNILIVIVALILLLIAAIGVAMVVIDPNDYKGHIEQAAADNTNLELELAGDIGWSFIPLGIEVNEVSARLEGDEFAAMEQLVASVDLWSLIMMSPSVHTFTLDGLNANLVKGKDGTGNWQRIMPEAPEAEEATETTTPEATLADEETGEELIQFNVQQIRISNARVSYEDRQTGQSFLLENATLEADDIALGQDFPLDIAFTVGLSEPELHLDGSLSMQLNASGNLQAFSVNDLDGQFNMTGEPFNGKTTTASITGSASADLDDETASVSDLVASFENLELTTNLDIQGFGDTPDISGDLAIAEFSAVELLEHLGQPAIETEDEDVLKRIAMNTNIGTEQQTVQLQNFTLRMDDTELKGTAGYGLDGGAISADLQGNSLNLDRYLPPEPEEDGEATAATETDTGGDEPAAGNRDNELLPLETLRALTLDIRLGLDQLIAKNLTINDILIRATGDEGQLSLDEVSGKLYEGDFELTAGIDARTDNPQWRFTERLSGVKSQPLLVDLIELDLISGRVNVNAEGRSTGNSVNALLENSGGKADFNIEEGALENTNLTRMACQGISRIHGESLENDDWGESTPFNDMSGNFTIDSGRLRNDNLTADVAGIRLEGDGVVDLIQSNLDYRLGLRIVGEIHRDQACRVNERIQNVVIPVRCEGAFSDDPGGLCGFDSARFSEVLKSMGEAEIERKRQEVEEKAEKEIKRGEEKLKDKAKEKLEGLFN